MKSLLWEYDIDVIKSVSILIIRSIHVPVQFIPYIKCLHPGSRYIVSNAYMAYAILDVMGVWDGHDYGDYRTWTVNLGSGTTNFQAVLVHQHGRPAAHL